MSASKSLDDLLKEHKGVSIRGDSIRIAFTYKGVRCKETLKNVSVSETNILFASNKRTAILHEITTNCFDYRKHFPDSKRANVFSPVREIPLVKDALDDWLKSKEGTITPKSLSYYRSCADKRIKPKFGERRLNEIQQSEVKRWRSHDLGSLSNKTINDIMTPLRGIYEEAMGDRLIDFNPLNHVTNLERDSEDNADPFTMKEIEAIRNGVTTREQERNAVLFACFSGVRISEWLALAWEDVDFVNREVKIQRSVVQGNYSYPKTKGSVRIVHLLDQAWDMLIQQKPLTYMLSPVEVSVLQHDKRRKKKERLNFVFRDSFTLEPIHNSARVAEKFFDDYVRKIGIRHRGPNQARHTFASQLLTKGVAERWIMREMGHTSIQMFEKHYGRWMDAEMPDMAKTVSQILRNGPNMAQIKLKSV